MQEHDQLWTIYNCIEKQSEDLSLAGKLLGDYAEIFERSKDPDCIAYEAEGQSYKLFIVMDYIFKVKDKLEEALKELEADGSSESDEAEL